MSANVSPPESSAPNGYLVRLVALQGEGKKERALCQELEWFFGSNAEELAQAHFRACLDVDNLNDLTPGKYRITMHPAWRGNELEPAEYDDTTTLGRTTFILTRRVDLELCRD